MLPSTLSSHSLHDLLTPEAMTALFQAGWQPLLDRAMPYLFALLLTIVVAEIVVGVMERLADRLLPRIPIPFLSSLILTVMMPLIYLVQLLILGSFLLWLIPFLTNLL